MCCSQTRFFLTVAVAPYLLIATVDNTPCTPSQQPLRRSAGTRLRFCVRSMPERLQLLRTRTVSGRSTPPNCTAFTPHCEAHPCGATICSTTCSSHFYLRDFLHLRPPLQDCGSSQCNHFNTSASGSTQLRSIQHRAVRLAVEAQTVLCPAAPSRSTDKLSLKPPRGVHPLIARVEVIFVSR